MAQARIREVFAKRANEEEKVVAKFFDSVSDKINLQFAELQNLTRQLEDSMRKPLHGIDEVFAQLYSMLQNAREGGRLWFVGMTLGLGPPHKYRISKTPPTGLRLQQSERRLQDEKSAESFSIEKAQDPVLVCLTNDRDVLKEKFLAKLAKRSSYSTLLPDMEKVVLEIMSLHHELAKKAPANRPIKYVDSIPLQILIVERGDSSPLAVAKKACVVFHVGTGNIETHVLEDGETGFYTEVDSVVEMFETMAESLWEAGQTGEDVLP